MTETDSQVIELLTEVKTELTELKTEVNARFASVDQRLDVVDKDIQEMKKQVEVWSGRIFNLYNGAFVTIALGIVLYIVTQLVKV